MSSDVQCAKVSRMTCSEGISPPGKMYLWIHVHDDLVARSRSWAMVMA